MYSLIKNKLPNLIEYLFCLFLFLLPWQTRWIYSAIYINDSMFEYASLSFYATEILLWLIIFLFSFWYFFDKTFWQVLKNKKTNWKITLSLVVIILFFFLQPSVNTNVLSKEVASQWGMRLIESWCIFTVLVIMINFNFNKKRSFFNNLQEKFLWAFYMGASVQAILAIWQFVFQNVFASKWLGLASHVPSVGGSSVVEFYLGRFLRAYGAFGSPNSLGIYLGIALIIGFILITFNSKFVVKFWRWLILFQSLILFGLILTFSRNAYLATILGLFTWLILYYFNYRNSLNFKNIFRKIIIMFSTLTALSFIFTAIFWQILSARVNFNNRLEDRSISERIGQYEEGKNIFKENKFFGVGGGNYTLALAQMYPDREVYKYEPVHNMYFLSLVELGIFGWFIYWALVIFLLYKIKSNKIEYLGLMVAFLVFGLFDHWLISMYSGILFFWLILGISLKSEKIN